MHRLSYTPNDRLWGSWFYGFVTQEPVGIALAILIAAVSVAYMKRLRSNLKNKTSPVPQAQRQHGANKPSKYGEWTPIDFVYPPITASPEEPLETEPIPYRPFRYGEYHVTMGIRSMRWNEWIELDNMYEKYHRIREYRMKTRGDRVIKVLPDNPGIVKSGSDAAIETVHELSEYLSQRFPNMFEIERHAPDKIALHPGWGGAAPIKSIRIKPLALSYELPLHVNDGENAATRALEVAAHLIQEDFALMIEGTDGRYYFQAGVICVAGFWRMEDKLGMPLDEIHNSGGVPRYKDKLQFSMERFFQRLSVDKPVARNNYFFQIVKPSDVVEDVDLEELAWAESSHGPEDGFSHTHPAQQPTRPTPIPSNIRLRTERQTLRRLPRSGAILFTIRTYLTPMDKLGQEPGVARRLASALRGWGEDIGAYKGKTGGGWWDVVLEYLDKAADEERRDGKGEDTDNYPL